MWKDKIVEEIRKYRDEYASKFNYDLHEICQDLRKKQNTEGRKIYMLHPRPVKQMK